MAITEYTTRPVPQIIAHKVTRPRQTKKWIDWVTTTDHKKIGIMYLILTFVFFALGGVEVQLLVIADLIPSVLRATGHRAMLLGVEPGAGALLVRT